MNSTLGGCDDGGFGPSIQGCRDDFDFTLSFEEYIFTVAPAAVLLAAAPARMLLLHRKPAKVDGVSVRLAKMVSIAVFTALQLAQLVLWATELRFDSARKSALVAAVVSLAAGLALAPLSYLEHVKSLRPSLLASTYLSLSLLLDIATLRTLWLSGRNVVASVFAASFAVKFVMLLLEAAEKRRFFRPEYRQSGPEESAGLFAQSLMWWVNPIIWSGARRLLKPDDLYPIAPDMASESLLDRFWVIWTKKRPTGKYPLPKAMMWLLWRPFAAAMIPRLALIGFTLCQPLLMKSVLAYLNDADTLNNNSGRGFIGAAALVYVGIAISSTVYWHRHYRFMAMTRGALTTAIYRMATRLRLESSKNAKVVTLMSTDCEQVVRGLVDLHELWANLVQVAIAIWLIEIEVGVACVAPIAVTIVTIGLTMYAAKLTPSFQTAWLGKLQNRISVTTSILGSMKAIKISNLGPKSSQVLETSRKDELAAAKRFRMIFVFNSAVANTPQLLAPVVTFAVFIAVARSNGSQLDPAHMFTSLTLLILLAEPLFTLFRGVNAFMQAVGCLNRVEEFLLTPLPKERRNILTQSSDSLRSANDGRSPEKVATSSRTACISVQNGSFGWSEEGSTPVLRNVSFSILEGDMVFILGPVASGKSTLLKALLGETPYFEGSVSINDGEVAFCDQSPWLMNGSVRANITAFMPYDAELYRSVITACDLGPDMLALPQADKTLIGSKGFSLSSGQRQRVALARAVYSRKKVVILDDVLSQLDATTQLRILHRLLSPNGLFRQSGTTVILTTSSPRCLSYADKILLLNENGELQHQGTFEELRGVPGIVKDSPERLPDLITVSPDGKEDIDVPAPLTEEDGSKDEIPSARDDDAAKKARQATELSVYRYYFESASWRTILVFFALQISLAFLSSFPYVWLEWWSDANADTTFPNGQTNYYMGIYALLQVLAVAANVVVSWWTLTVLSVKSGFKLHDILIKTTMTATLKLFSSTDSGSLLNRFTQDIQLVDLQLPIALQVVVTTILTCIAQGGLIASATGWIALSYPFLIGLFYMVTLYYTRTSRQIRYLDLEQKAPLYAQFLESLEGMVSIRAFAWEHACYQKNYKLVDISQQPFYLMFIIQKWLSLVLDMAIAGLATLLIGLGVVLKGNIATSSMGVALTQVVSFTSYLKMMVLFLAQMQTSMAAIERISNFSQQTEKEDDSESDQAPSMDWPTRGGIEIKDLCVKYSADGDYVLNNVSMSVKPGEKVCICGRTGSGKSSLLLALLRLLDPSAGEIKVDRVNIGSVARGIIRSRVAGITEEPFFFPGTVRENVDPYGEASDDAILQALVDTNLWSALEKKGGLDAAVEKDMLSHGQRQLFGIARALVRETKILVLDEVTSSLDVQSEQMMHQVIETRLKYQTVIWVAHRLHFAQKFDKVVVMDKGRVAEVDTPAALLSRPSMFRDLFESGKNDGSEGINGET